MEVKGTAFLARRAMLVREFGSERFQRFFATVVQAQPAFAQPILATTVLPMRPFLAFNDMIVRDLYGGDMQSYVRFGEASAEWSLTEGPYKHLVASKSVDQFAVMGRILYANFFTAGRGESTLRPPGPDDRRVVEMRLLEIPREHHHPYIELAIPAYFRRGLELVSQRRVVMRTLRAFSKGDPEVHCEYTVG